MVTRLTMDQKVTVSNLCLSYKLRRQSGPWLVMATWGVRRPTDPPRDWRLPVCSLPPVIYMCVQSREKLKSAAAEKHSSTSKFKAKEKKFLNSMFTQFTILLTITVEMLPVVGASNLVGLTFGPGRLTRKLCA